MRAGKTISTLGFINNSSFRDIIIVCPKTVKLGWFSECKKWLIDNYHIQVVNSKTEVKDANIHIVNYDIIHTKTDLLTKKYDLVVLDEVHLAKNADRRRSKFVYGLQGEYKLGLSGTPLMNKPKDFLTVLQWLDPMWDKFVIKKDKFISASGLVLTLEQVQRLVRSTTMIRRESTVMDNEPIEKRVVNLLPDDDVIPLIKAQLRDLTDYGQVSKALGLAKVKLALNHIDVYTTDGEKLVVFAYHKDVIRRLASSLGSKAEVIFGESSEQERVHALNRFNTDPKCQVLIGSIGAMSMGLNLSISNHIIFVELDWTPGLMDQAAERCTDKNQDKSILVEDLVYEDSLDYYKLNKLEYKGLAADAATNC
jgi:SWI/SNF-related matrix-associated actin-dependent regulator 1 of chromatin subfamily A